MQLNIITPEKQVLSEDVNEVVAPTPNGEIAILPHHVNLVTKVQPGEMTVKTRNKTSYLAITGGFLEVNNNIITVLADYAVKAEEIEVEKAVEARKRAEEILKKTKENISEKDFAVAQADLRKAVLELHVANRHKKRQTP